jgi:uncharacterized protein (DUF302 family)
MLRGIAMTTEGLTTRVSSHGPKETMDRLAAAVTARGVAILARIDHAEAAAKVGLTLRPTELLIFGNAKAGTPLMQTAQTIGIDLPLKVLVWEDEASQTWLSYSDPEWLAELHGDLTGMRQILGSMAAMLAAVAEEAAS